MKIIILFFGLYFNVYADTNTSGISFELANSYIELIIVGIATLLFFFIKDVYNNAVEKKLIAIKLEAYLNNWINEISKHDDLFVLINLGQQWNHELVSSINDNKKFNDLYKKQNEELKKLKTELIENEDVNSHLKSLHSKIINMPDDLFKLNIHNIDDSIENLNNNISFISDHDASKISWHTADNVISTRQHILTILVQTKYLYYTLKNMTEFEMEPIREHYVSIVESIIIIGQKLNPLLDIAELIRKRNIFENMIN